MEIEVRLFATLRRYLTIPHNQGVAKITVNEGDKVIDVINSLQVPAKEITVIMVNGVRADEEHVLQEDDRVALFPPVGGG